MINKFIKEVPVIAILRGISPEEVLKIADVIYDSGIRCIEVTMNSPDPLKSISSLVNSLPNDCLIGGGTVVSCEEVQNINDVGGRLIVSPNTSPDVIKRALSLDMVVLPGCATPTDAFAAIDAGATHLKLFPAGSYGPKHLSSLLAVLPKDISILAVGGINATNILEWQSAGAAGFGIGSELYQAGDCVETVSAKAKALCSLFKR